MPYHESDHVLNLAYYSLLDGLRLQDIELRRNDEAFLDGLGAQRIPDPTTSGDFTRRFDQGSVVALMEALMLRDNGSGSTASWFPVARLY